MDNIPFLRDFDEPASFDPALVEDLAFGDVRDPYPVLHELASRGSVQECDLREMWGLAADKTVGRERIFMVFAYDDIREVLENPQVFSSEYFKAGLGQTLGPLALTVLDPPEHTRYRRIFQKVFLPNVVAGWSEEYIDPVINDLINHFVDRGRADLMVEFVRLFPFEIIYRHLMLPPGQAEIFYKLSVALVRYGFDLPHALEASRNLGRYFQAALEVRRRNPGTDLISILAAVELDGERLTDEAVITFLRQLITAAGDTSYRTSGNMLVGLLANRPDQLEMVKADRSLVANAIEETLRWEGPTSILYRRVVCDTKLGGVQIPAGATVQALVGVANRDPAVHSKPDHFDIMRSAPRAHMTFAVGPHICLGRHLARLEMSRALNILLDRLPRLRLDADYPAPEIRGIMFRSARHIYARFD